MVVVARSVFHAGRRHRPHRPDDAVRAQAFGRVDHGRLGASLHEAGRRVGHRSVVTTNRYAHLFDERDAEIAEAVDRLAREAAESRSRARNARPLRAPSGIASVTDLPHRP